MFILLIELVDQISWQGTGESPQPTRFSDTHRRRFLSPVLYIYIIDKLVWRSDHMCMDLKHFWKYYLCFYFNFLTVDSFSKKSGRFYSLFLWGCSYKESSLIFCIVLFVAKNMTFFGLKTKFSLNVNISGRKLSTTSWFSVEIM